MSIFNMFIFNEPILNRSNRLAFYLHKAHYLCRRGHLGHLQKLCLFTLPAAVLVSCAVFMTGLWSPYVADTDNKKLGACNIKGNISASGARVYHLPDSPWYGRTKIDPKAGEQWFCSETAARQAGWRSATYKRQSKSRR